MNSENIWYAGTHTHKLTTLALIGGDAVILVADADADAEADAEAIAVAVDETGVAVGAQQN